jgi:hypothetical protein
MARLLNSFAGLVVALGVLLCPSPTWASCGDWLSPHAVASPGGLRDLGDAHRAGYLPPYRPARLPCDGPGCQSAPELPSSLPERVLPDQPDRWGCMVAAGDGVESQARWWASADEDWPGLIQRGRIDRPPRG